VLLLPYLEEKDLYNQFKLDEPWDSDHNKKLLAKMPKLFALPGGRTKEPYTTFYQVFTGKGTVFDNPKGNRFADILDGVSNTIIITEGGQAVPWTKPADLAYNADKPLPRLGGLFNGGFHIVTADGRVRFIQQRLGDMVLRSLITRNGGEPINWNELER
jgi:hypothetical protein